MCVWGTDVELDVYMPAALSYTGEARWTRQKIDSCIAPLVDALNRARIFTAQSCCGHGQYPGFIELHDGRVLVITNEIPGT